MAGMNLWLLHARDAEEPPFHFSNVPSQYIVAAKTAEDARRIAASVAGEYVAFWRDDTMTDCVALAPKEPGLIAVEMSVRNIMMVDETEDRAAVAAAKREADATAASKAEFARMDAVRAQSDHVAVEAAEAAKKAAAAHAADPAVSRAAVEAAKKAAVAPQTPQTPMAADDAGQALGGPQTPITERETERAPKVATNPYVTKR